MSTIAQVIDLREVSNKIAGKMIKDPEFKAQFLKDPIAVLHAEGVPAEYIPAKVDVDAQALDKALGMAEGTRYRLGEGDGKLTAVAVACVVC